MDGRVRNVFFIHKQCFIIILKDLSFIDSSLKLTVVWKTYLGMFNEYKAIKFNVKQNDVN